MTGFLFLRWTIPLNLVWCSPKTSSVLMVSYQQLSLLLYYSMYVGTVCICLSVRLTPLQTSSRSVLHTAVTHNPHCNREAVHMDPGQRERQDVRWLLNNSELCKRAGVRKWAKLTFSVLLSAGRWQPSVSGRFPLCVWDIRVGDWPALLC